MPQQQQPHQPSNQTNPKDLYKHTPPPNPGQAVESGEPTLTGDTTDKNRPNSMPNQPKERAHPEPGEKR